jgi:tetratricopeptide (TPR) repeat protein
MGIIFYLKGEDEKAMEAFNKALSINPNHIGSHIHLGTLYKKKGQMEKGIESYQKALTIDPHHGETHYNLGLLYEQVGNRELAVLHYQQFIQSSSNVYPELALRVRRHIQQMLKTKEGKKE